MNLYEYQGKEIFRKAGIPVPESRLIRNHEDLEEAAEIFNLPAMLKAQVLAGKRGKAGLIKLVESWDQVKDITEDWIGKKFNGEVIESVLIEKALDIDRELYLSVTVDPAAGSPLVIASGEGGVDIEEISERKPEAVVKKHINIFRGLFPFQVRDIIRDMGLGGPAGKACGKVLSALYGLFRSYDAELVEINPLVIDREGNLLAVDSKIRIDDGALFRHKEFSKTANHFGDELEYEAYQNGLTYIRLDGDIGVICTGAGLTMATLDLVKLNGGKPANFLDFGGDNYKNAADALRIVLKNPNVKALLLVTFGLFARADTIAEGVVQAINEFKPKVPIIMAVRGTGEEKARELIKEIGIETVNDTEEAVRRAISIAEV
jgi:succinyl-CoA synthetase beta subunit